MCRISGIASHQVSTESLALRIQQMNDCQKHGGPDGEGATVHAELGVALGHRRLALLDLSLAGMQPMLDQSSNYEILFNGEIYNYIELKNNLIKYIK